MSYKSIFSKDFNLDNPTKDTELLFNEIKEATNIYAFLKENTVSYETPSFSTYFQQLLKDNEISKSQLLYMSCLSRSFIYAILKGDRIPSRDTTINLSFSIKATLEESYNLLKYSGHQPLYAKDLRDTIIIFGIKQKMSLDEVNDILYDLNIEIIGW